MLLLRWLLVDSFGGHFDHGYHAECVIGKLGMLLHLLLVGIGLEVLLLHGLLCGHHAGFGRH